MALQEGEVIHEHNLAPEGASKSCNKGGLDADYSREFLEGAHTASPPSSAGSSFSEGSVSAPSEQRGTADEVNSSRSRWTSIKKYLVDPRRIFHKYFLLVLICLFIPGPYYHDSLLSAYKGPISDQMHLSNKKFGMLFAFSSLTGVFCGPAGVVVMRVGRTRMALVASLACSLASLFVVLGFRWGSLKVMIAARFVFWLGLYGLLLVQTLLVYSIFEGKALNMAFSLLIFAMRLGAVFGFFLSGPLMHWMHVFGSLLFSASLVFAAFGATLLFAYLFRGTSTAQAVRPLLSGNRGHPKAFSLALVREVPGSVLVLICALGCVYGTVFPFEVVADDMLQKEFSYNADNAGFLLTTIPLVALASPLFSPWLGSKVTQKLVFGAAGLGMLVAAQVVLAVQKPWSPMVGFGLMGCGYAVSACALWVVLPQLARAAVPADRASDVEGLAAGLAYAAVALSQFASNLAVGVVKDLGSYRWVCTWFASLALLGLLSCIAACVLHKARVSRGRVGDSEVQLARTTAAERRSPAESFQTGVALVVPEVTDLAMERSCVQEDYFPS